MRAPRRMPVARTAAARTAVAASMLALTIAGGHTAVAEASVSPAKCATAGQPAAVGISDRLTAVAVASACSAWAVGWYSNGRADQTLTEHWDGSSWHRYAGVNPAGRGLSNDLLGVAFSGRNGWAVGTCNDGIGLPQSLIERWTGRKWIRTASPDPGGRATYNVLNAVASQSPSNAFAVGYFSEPAINQALIAHWNGHAWADVPSPVLPGGAGSALSGVAFSSAASAWAVGYLFTGDHTFPLIEHWNGAIWKVVTTLRIVGTLYSVAVVSRHDAWAVGNDNDNGTDHTLIEHWNGHTWGRVTSPDLAGSTGDLLQGVTVSSAGGALAVGYADTGDSYRPLVEQWTGRAWAVVTRTRPAVGPAGLLSGVAGSSPADIWAVGYRIQAKAQRALAVRR